MIAAMVRLTREVRFGIALDGGVIDGDNGFAGNPPLGAPGVFLALRVTLAGNPDRDTGYLLNIKDVDREVRSRVVPVCAELVAKAQAASAEALVGRCAHLLSDAWKPVEMVELDLRVTPFLSVSWKRSESRMVRLSQKFEFSAAHRLHSDALSAEANRATFGKCNNPHGHGHNYEVEVTVAGIPDEKTGRLIAVDELERIVEAHVIEPLDHKHLNLEVPEFGTLNPSVENIAQVIFDRLSPVLKGSSATLAKVTVWETPKTWAAVGD